MQFLSKFHQDLFADIDKLILNYIWKDTGTERAKVVFKQKGTVERTLYAMLLLII